MRFRRLVALMMLCPALVYAQAGRELTDSVMQARYQTSGTCPPAVTFCDSASEVGREFVCTDAPNAGVTYACTSVGVGGGSGLRSGAVEYLVSLVATAGDKLTLTSDGTNLTLKPSRAGSDIIFTDQAGVDVMRIYDSTSVVGTGLDLPFSVSIGKGTELEAPTPDSAAPFKVVATQSDYTNLIHAMLFNIDFDQDQAGTDRAGVIMHTRPADGFDAFAGGGTMARFDGVQILFDGDLTTPWAGSVTTAAAARVHFAVAAPAGPAWTEAVGYDLTDVSITNGSVPARSYGTFMRTGGNGTLKWAGMFTGNTQIAGTSANARLMFGLNNTTYGTESIRRSAASTLTFEIASTDEIRINASGVFPATENGSGLGADGTGFDYLWMGADDTNPACAAGDYNIFADLSEAKFKKCTNGVASDLDTGGSGTPGGSNTQVQFNDSSAFGGDAGLTYDKTADTLSIGTGSAGNMQVVDQASACDDPAAGATSLCAIGGHLAIRDTGGASNLAVTRDASLTAHGVVLGDGTNPVNVTAAGTAGAALTSGGASADPTFQYYTWQVYSSLSGLNAYANAGSTYTWTANRVLCDRISIPPGTHLNMDTVSYKVTTQDAGNVLAACVYSADGSSLLANNNACSTTGTGDKDCALAYDMVPGEYNLCLTSASATATLSANANINPAPSARRHGYQAGGGNTCPATISYPFTTREATAGSVPQILWTDLN